MAWTTKPPPLPPQPWLNPSRLSPPEKLDPSKVPLLPASARQVTAASYIPAAPAKALALGRGGANLHAWNRGSENAAMRAALQGCAYTAQRPCFIYALNDDVVVRTPEVMRPVDVFFVDDLTDLRDADRQRIESAYVQGMDWRALAIGRNGRIGIAVRQTTEQLAIDQALRDCSRNAGLDCTIVAIGPFTVARR